MQCVSFCHTHFMKLIISLSSQKRKRAVTVHVADANGDRLQGAAITIEQIDKDFPFGSAIASTILGNIPYQVTGFGIIIELQSILRYQQNKILSI